MKFEANKEYMENLSLYPVTGLKCVHMEKFSSPLTEIPVGKTEISGTKPGRPLIRTHRKFYKGFRGRARSRKPDLSDLGVL